MPVLELELPRTIDPGKDGNGSFLLRLFLVSLKQKKNHESFPVRLFRCNPVVSSEAELNGAVAAELKLHLGIPPKARAANKANRSKPSLF